MGTEPTERNVFEEITWFLVCANWARQPNKDGMFCLDGGPWVSVK